jgi:minor extracellular serine protease Vpr
MTHVNLCIRHRAREESMRPQTPFRALTAIVAFLLMFASVAPAAAQTPLPPIDPARIEQLRLDAPVEATNPRSVLSSSLQDATGRQQVVVRLRESPAAGVPEGAAQAAQVDRIRAQQDRVLARIQAIDPSAIEYARLRIGLNALIVEVDATALPAIARDTEVVRINPVVNYERDLDETVPYIGASLAVQNAAFRGRDVRVAVLDSGIDYTHAKFGGVGTLAAYRAAYGNSPGDSRNKTLDGLFPTNRVKGGYDFVGEVWPNGPLQPDPDPIDCGVTALASGTCAGGHGTHVADIIGGNPIPDPERARVRAVHASPDAPNVDVLVNDTPAFTNVPFRAVSNYALLPPGTYNLKVVPAGASAPVVINADVTVEAGKDYTVAATGLLAGIAPLVLVDDNSAPAPGNAHVRFIHLSPNAPAVDVAVAGGGPVIFSNVSFRQVGAYTPVPAGTYNLEVRLAGTNTVVLSIPGVNLRAGKVYTAYAFGLVGGTGAQALGAGLSEDNFTAGGGVAPEVDLYAVKVCSAVSSSCSGIALLQGLEFAADPNGDGITDDHVHIVNMSLGASYGQNYDDDLSILVDAVTSVGILVVASAGNSADRPYISGTPAAARTALSVAQTAVPRDKVFPITVSGVTVYGIAQPWAPEPTTAISGQLVYGASLGNALGCTSFPAGSLTGQVLLVDRGACAVSTKGSNGAAAGAVAVIVANNAAGDVPPSFGFGGGTPTVPTLSITQAAGNQLKTRVGNIATVDGASAQSVVGSVVGTSSRGPVMGQMFYGNQVMYGQIIKPEIGAPGASISAVAGSGNGVEPFGGTSGAAPVVAGAAALLMNATDWQLSPMELKARLMNTAETNILNGPAVFIGPSPAPITRIGGGEVRIDRAIASQASAWESVSGGGALSFGMVDLTRETTLRRTVVVRNYGDTPLTYAIIPTFRFANDAATGAVTPVAPATITVPPRSQRSFPIALRIDPTKLQTWTLDSGLNGGNGAALTLPEYDGYLVLDAPGSSNDLTMPWHVLPRAAGNVRAPSSVRLRSGSATATLTNSGVNPVDFETFALIGENPFVTASPGAGQQAPPMDLRYIGVRAFDGTGICPANSPIIQFAINTHQRITHSNYPVQFILDFDTNLDGTPDFTGFTSEAGTFASSGQNAFFVGVAGSGRGTALFFTDHPTNSSNTVVTICGSQIGVASPGQAIGIDAYAYDNYFTGNELSYIDGMRAMIGAPRYVAIPGFGTVPASGSSSLTIAATGSTAATTESGILVMFSFAPSGNEARAIKVR